MTTPLSSEGRVYERGCKGKGGGATHSFAEQRTRQFILPDFVVVLTVGRGPPAVLSLCTTYVHQQPRLERAVRLLARPGPGSPLPCAGTRGLLTLSMLSGYLRHHPRICNAAALRDSNNQLSVSLPTALTIAFLSHRRRGQRTASRACPVRVRDARWLCGRGCWMCSPLLVAPSI